MKLTEKQLFIGGLLVNHLEGLVVYEFIETYKNELIENHYIKKTSNFLLENSQKRGCANVI